MTYDMVKYERGQVWIIRHKYKNDAVGHEQSKDRPWLILSVGKFNKSSGCFTAVPITTRDKARTVAQVHFFNERGDSNVIMCEQIKTFDHSSGAYIFDYMGQLSDEVLEKVDVALSVHLGLHYSPITLKSLYDSMESMIKSIGYMQDKDSSPKFTDDDVLQFAEKLQMLASTPATQEVSATYVNPLDKYRGIPEEDDEEPTNVVVASLTRIDEVVKPPEPTPEKAPRMKWTKEKCEEFLQDCDTMPMSKVMDKWNMLKKSKFYSMRNYTQNLLMKMTQS